MAVSVNKNLAASYILEDPLGRIANDGRVSNLGRVGLKGYVDSRFAVNFDGVDDYGVLAYRAINPDGDNTYEFYTSNNLTGVKTIVSQNISSTSSAREFQLYTDETALSILRGGNITTITSSVKPNTKYGLTQVGNTVSLFEGGLGGTLVASLSATNGAAREPTAQTVIGARGNGAGLFSSHSSGLQYNVRINGTLWPMADRNQAIQLPEPSDLGAELITPTVLENPAVKGSQWTYLGSGRWQYVGDGSLNELRFINAVDQPATGYLEFEIESISGQLNCTSGNNSPAAVFNTIGVKRYFYTAKGSSNENTFLFKRHFSGVGIVTSCVIKNISFKPLGTCNPMTLVNVTSDRWQEVPQ